MQQLLRWHIPRALGAALILGILLSAITVSFVELRQPATNWINNAPQNLAHLRERVEKLLPTDKIKQAADVLNQTGVGEKGGKAPALELKSVADPGKAINWTAGFLAGLIEMVVLLYMFLVLGDAFMSKILNGGDPQERKRVMTISNEVQQNISHYLFTVSIINFSLGIAVGLGLYFLGVPNAPLWALLAALLNYIPYFGPITGMIIVMIVNLVTFDTFPRIMLPAAWYLLLHLAEADFITPVLLGRHFTISPLVVFASLLFGIWLWGVLGALLCVPILISLKVLCERVPALTFANRFL